MGATSGLGRSTPKPKRGSSFTDRQIAQSVKSGRAVRVTLPDGSDRTGWVCGGDDYHWGIVSPDGVVSMVHKSVPCLDVTEMELDRQPEHVRDLVEPVLGSYRDYVMRTHFNAAPATT